MTRECIIAKRGTTAYPKVRIHSDESLSDDESISYPSHYNVVSLRELISTSMPSYKVDELKLAKTEVGEALKILCSDQSRHRRLGRRALEHQS